MKELQDQINKLAAEIDQIKGMFNTSTSSVPLTEFIRDVVVYDQDTVTATSYTQTDSRGDSVVVTKIPTQYLRVYFKGKPFNVGAYPLP